MDHHLVEFSSDDVAVSRVFAASASAIANAFSLAMAAQEVPPVRKLNYLSSAKL